MRPGPEPDPDYVRSLDRLSTRTIDRTGGTALHSSRTNPKRMRAGNLPDFVGPDRLAAMQTGDGIYDFTPVVLENLERLGIDTLISIGGDDTLSYSKVLADAGDHPGEGRDQPPADHPGLARADRRLPDLRPECRLHRPAHRIRDLGAVRDPGVPLRPPASRRRARRGSPQQPEPVLVRDRIRGRPPQGDGAPGGRRSRCLRPPPQGEHRRVPGRRDPCLLYTSDAADDLLCVDLGGRRI